MKIRSLLALFAVLLGHAALARATEGEVVFVRGEVHRVLADGAQRALEPGHRLKAGEALRSGPNGFAHVRFPDGGFVGLRPGSRFVLDEYVVDSSAPGGVRVRYRLDEGSMRGITGQVIEQNRNRFRLNTPVVAVGVRGTDYVVQATGTATRVAVNSGAVAVTPFGPGCDRAALGPCSADTTRILTAGPGSGHLEYRQGARSPEIRKTPLPGAAGDEPPPSARPASSGETEAVVMTTASRVEQQAAERAPPMQVVWGRWSFLPAAGPTAGDRMTEGYQPMYANAAFGLFVRQLPNELPRQGVVGFALSGSQAVVLGAGGLTEAMVRAGSMRVDFGARQFETSLAVDALGATRELSAAGGFDWQGNMRSDPARSSMGVLGAFGGAKGGDAGYVFEKVLEPGAVLSGVTTWRR